MKRSTRFYDHPSEMEPLLPEDREGTLAGLALGIIRRAERLRGGLHPITQRGVADLVRSMNPKGTGAVRIPGGGGGKLFPESVPRGNGVTLNGWDESAFL